MGNIKDLPTDFDSVGEAELVKRLHRHARFASKGVMTWNEFASNSMDILADYHAFYPKSVPIIWDFISDEIRVVLVGLFVETLQPNYIYNKVFHGGRKLTEEENRVRWSMQTEMLRNWARAFLEYNETQKPH